MSLEELSTRLQIFILQTQLNAHTLILVVCTLWGVYLLNLLLQRRLFCFGIVPRRWYGLPGILCAPLLHANFNHLFFNTVPLVVLSDFLLYNGAAYYIQATLGITLLCGLFIWLICKPGIYIGASAVITGYWGLLVSGIYQQGTFMAIILGLVSVYYFAGILAGLFPKQNGGSWQGHACGLAAGLIYSVLSAG